MPKGWQHVDPADQQQQVTGDVVKVLDGKTFRPVRLKGATGAVGIDTSNGDGKPRLNNPVLAGAALDEGSNAALKVVETVLTSDGATLSVTVPTGYRHLQVVIRARTDQAVLATTCRIRINGDAGAAAYSYTLTSATAGVVSSNESDTNDELASIDVPANNAPANHFGLIEFLLADYLATDRVKTARGGWRSRYSTTEAVSGTFGGEWLSTAAVTSISLVPGSGNFKAGSSIYVLGLPD